MFSELIELTLEDKKVSTFSSDYVEKWLLKNILDRSDVKKIIIVIGAPGIGKTHLCHKIENNLIDVAQIVDVKEDVHDEEGLARVIELANSNKVILDNFESVFKYSFPNPVYDWASLYEENRTGPNLFVHEVKEFFSGNGIRLVVFIQNLAYYMMRHDFIRLVEEISSKQLHVSMEIISLGLPDDMEKLRIISSYKPYQIYIESLLEEIINNINGIDSPPVVFLANAVSRWKEYKKKNRGSEILMIKSNELKSFSVDDPANVEVNRRIFGKLGLAYVPSSDQLGRNIIVYGEVLNSADKILKRAGYFSTSPEGIVTFFVLGIPFAFTLLLSLIFIAGLYGYLIQIPTWVIAGFILVGLPLVAILVGWIFSNL